MRETCVYNAYSLQTAINIELICYPLPSILLSMSRKYKIRDQDKVHFVTFTVIQWLDVFTRQAYRDIFLDSIRYCQKHKGLELYAYCIMTSHIHMIVARRGEESLEGIIRDIKKFTAVKIIDAIRNNPQESRKELLMWLFERAGERNGNNTTYQFWQQHSHPVELSTDEMLTQRLDYIHNNPVESGIVASPEDYLYSSAVNYAELPEKLIDVILI
jgi:putative transposase